MTRIFSEEKVFCQFPLNLRILVIDIDPLVLEFIKKTCNECCYQVMTCTESLHVADICRDRKVSFNLVLMEVHMPNMDGYEFLLSQKMDVPVIMMSFDDDKKSVMKAIKLGACDYWIKPLHEDRIKNMWTHVVRKSMSGNKMQKEIIGNLEDDDKKKMISSDDSTFVFSSTVEISREVHNVGESKNCGKKKSRIVWTSELHRKFVEVVDQIGLASLVPKGEHQSFLDMQLDNHFHAEQALVLAHGYPFTTYPNTIIPQNFPHSIGTLDDASTHGLWSSYNTVFAGNQAMLQSNNDIL
ncbi:hypothetical protein VNO80_22037 [Phaseolus coccineus]|uniref:Response regulatory domain-containing protein n=1 Tax=Phaseolus coccineus TaxID=3886 RepID=A0AAN9M3E4_PHACN